MNDALVYFDKLPYYHIVSDQNVKDFWKMLVYLIKKRDTDQQEFENRPENLTKTKQQLLDEFELISPKILDKLGKLWNKILEKAGLEFDVENASNPIQLTDNLKAYIVLKGSNQRINYNQLSTGIRNYIFRIGHIFTLYFNRSIDNGFLLLDEPENSLFPDFLFELMETYETLVLDKNGKNNTQIFMTTHNPIVAAQFEPWERIILEWKTDGTVKAQKGRTPVGDDPNDILKNDFGLQNLMGKKGIEVWNEYLDLKKELRKSQNGNKNTLVDKITKIGSAYNFE
ncbi:MAG TPA: AAA family ATPase [Saprospiraceae bacterium]|nr:AAA family ATPase [Saprospiraceae bacterium]